MAPRLNSRNGQVNLVTVISICERTFIVDHYPSASVPIEKYSWTTSTTSITKNTVLDTFADDPAMIVIDTVSENATERLQVK